MFNTESLYNQMKARKLEKIQEFMEFSKENYIKDVKTTAEIYTRDKGTKGYTVCKLKSGNFALVKNGEILFKNSDVHLCKVEFIMHVHYYQGSSDMDMFINKL